jgi:hypothetical protein
MSTSIYYDTLISKVDNVTTCSGLSDLGIEINDVFTVNLLDIQGSIDALAPLLVAPSADLGAIITWITSVIDTYTLQTAQLLTLQTETLLKQAEAVLALSDKFTELGCS